MTHVIGTQKPNSGKKETSVSTLKLTTRQWRNIRNELHKEHPRTVMMLKSKMKSVLGFTVREHSGYRLRTAKELEDYDRSDNIWHEAEKDRKFYRENINEHFIALDFYNDRKYTMFLLKFSELINGRD
jgi:hypothetical protein